MDIHASPILSIFTAVKQFFGFLLEVFSILCPFVKDAESTSWRSELVLRADKVHDATENEEPPSNVRDTDPKNVSELGCMTVTGWNSTQYEESSNTLSNAGSWAPKLICPDKSQTRGNLCDPMQSSRSDSPTFTKPDEGVPETKPCSADPSPVCIENCEKVSWALGRTSKQNEEETKIELPASSHGEPVNVPCTDSNNFPEASALEDAGGSSSNSSDVVGSLNDLSKDFKDVDRTKKMLSNLSDDKSESTSTNSVDNEKRDPAKGVGSLMCGLFEKQLYTDVTFYFEKQKTFLSAHRLVLAAKCPFFEDLLFGKLAKDAVGMEMHVQIDDVPLGTFTTIVKYFYTDHIELVEDGAVLDLYKAVKRYRIDRLVDLCDVYVDSIGLTRDNVCSTLGVAISQNIDSLKIRCLAYIQKNTRSVISSSDFEGCSLSAVREVCKLDDVHLDSEMDLLEAVLRWLNVQKASRQVKGEWRRGLLKGVRFLSLTPREFTDVLQRHPHLLTPNEGLKILIYLNNPCPENRKKLPKWCNKSLRTFHLGNKSVQNPISQTKCTDPRFVEVTLKPAKGHPGTTPLTSLLHMRCVRGTHRITSLTFDFESVASGGCSIGIIISIVPDGPTFNKCHLAKSRDSQFRFEKPVVVYAGQTVQIEATAECARFLRFQNWYADRLDFQCFFISRPESGRLYFIAEVEYEPVAKT